MSNAKILSSEVNEINNVVVNVAQVQQLSPFRYPGGKTWLVPRMRNRLNLLGARPRLFIEPFAGGAIMSLTAAVEDWAEKIIFCELDKRVSAVWHTILDDSDWLCERILTFQVNENNVKELLDLRSGDLSRRELAFQTIVRNRVQHGGKIAPGASLVKFGENGKGLLSRWYPQTIVRRIRVVNQCKDKLVFFEGDGFNIIQKHLGDKDAYYFIDPPYTAGGKNAGKRLYYHNEINHDSLFALMNQVAGKFVMTYDDCPEVSQLADRHRFDVERILMKNTHNKVTYELLIDK